MNIHDMNNLNDLDISLLGFLVEKPLHGYELHREVTDLKGFGIVWKLKIGKLYTMLNKLHSANLVTTTSYREGNRPIRNEYYITANGEKTFREWLKKPVQHGRDFRNSFLLKLFFSLKQSKLDALNLITAQQQECVKWQRHFSEKLINQKNAKESSTNFEEFVHRYRWTQVEAFLKWLDWISEKIIREAE